VRTCTYLSILFVCISAEFIQPELLEIIESVSGSPDWHTLL